MHTLRRWTTAASCACLVACASAESLPSTGAGTEAGPANLPAPQLPTPYDPNAEGAAQPAAAPAPAPQPAPEQPAQDEQPVDADPAAEPAAPAPESEPGPARAGPPDRCGELGDACDVCACRLCEVEISACEADPACDAVMDCAREAGCSGAGCLGPCGDAIDAAGGAFSDTVEMASAVSDCRDDQCGDDPMDCSLNDPGPPMSPAPAQPEPQPGPQPQPEPQPAANVCDAIGVGELCGEGVDGADAWCDVYMQEEDVTCDAFCERFGARCLEGFGERDDSCEKKHSHGCDEEENDQICRCAF